MRRNPAMNDNRNTLLAIALSAIILIAWQYFVGLPKMEAERQKQQAEETLANPDPAKVIAPQAGAPQPAPAGVAPGANPANPSIVSREDALASTPRIAIETPRVGGSLNLKGGRIDDIFLKNYHETVNPSSKEIVLLSPAGGPNAYYAEFGWVSAPGATVKMPDEDTVWQLDSGTSLTPASPVTLTYDNGEGLLFKRTYSVDQNYMITLQDSVENRGGGDVSVFPYGFISRHGTPKTQGFYVLHEGIVGVLGEQEGLQEIAYKKIQEEKLIEVSGSKGWLGITDKYWAAVLVPDQATPYSARVAAIGEGEATIYQTSFLLDERKLAPGATTQSTSRLFAGAKEVHVVDGYEDALGIYKFELLIDWGWFYFITKPLFFALDYCYKLVGNFGIAILIVTVLVKLLFFPLANKSYVSMSRMKLVQPELVKIRERYKDDRAKQQQAMMELYKKEKINPAAGCLPVIVQIPVFFALYKVLFVTIEMRHAPFFGWIKDLAAPDPTSVFNLFGLIPWDPSVVPVFGHFLMLGVWPLIMGITMFLQMRLNPPPPDPTQAMIFNWMPLLFTFMLASFPAGLVIYWAWNNTLSIIQQSVIMKRQGVKIELWDNLRGLIRKQPTAKPGE